jgi:glutamate-1-semialdehyde 2,1-aminomutase
MLWMIRCAGTFPAFVKETKGAHFTDVDGKSYIDFCLGDTGAMTGHAPEKTIQAIKLLAFYTDSYRFQPICYSNGA